MSTLQLTKKFPSKRAFITGAGSGLGRALSLALAADGWIVGITDISEKALSETQVADQLKGGKTISYRFDVADKEAYKNAIDDYVRKVGGVDVLINNAGVGDGGLFGEYDLKDWDWIIGINQMGVIYGSHLVVPHMKKQGSGHIISIASAAGYANMPNMTMYSVPKAAVIAFSESIYPELKPFGIGVSVVMPTFFRTNIMQYGRGNDDAMKVGDAMLQRSNILPEEVAMKILEQAGKGKFHIFHPFQAKFVWYVKRFFPSLFLTFKAYMFKNKEWVNKKIVGK